MESAASPPAPRETGNEVIFGVWGKVSIARKNSLRAKLGASSEPLNEWGYPKNSHKFKEVK